MIKEFFRLVKTDFLYRVGGFLAATYIRLVFMTTKWTVLGADIPDAYLQAKKPFIVCFWHGRLAMLVYAWRWKNHPFHMLSSAHRDARLIVRTVAYFGITSIIGSTRRGGTEALRKMLAILQQGETIGITPDGPRGPAQVVSPGVITVARLAKVDIIPLTFSTSRSCFLSTWDRLLLPLPCGRGVFFWGAPLAPPDNKGAQEFEASRYALEVALTSLQDRADELMGVNAR